MENDLVHSYTFTEPQIFASKYFEGNGLAVKTESFLTLTNPSIWYYLLM